MSTHPLTAYRVERNISLQDLAKAAGTTRQTVWRIEKGCQEPSFAILRKLSAATNGAVTVEALAAATISSASGISEAS